MFRRGVADLLSAEADIEVVGEASTAAQARVRIAATAPDVVLLDVRLTDGSGIDVCRDLHDDYPNIRFLILTAHDDEKSIYAAVIAGAVGYILKDIRSTGLIDAVCRAAAGRTLLHPSLRNKAVEAMRVPLPEHSPLDALSVRESEVLELIADGLTNRQIGEVLDLAEKTVKNYVSSVLSKLGLQRRTQAVAVKLETRHTDAPTR
jgi:DNA-binding NarL/FixJ family response regulator